jgi:hypothetical protein
MRQREGEGREDQASESGPAPIAGPPFVRLARADAAVADASLDVMTQAESRFIRFGEAELDRHSTYS